MRGPTLSAELARSGVFQSFQDLIRDTLNLDPLMLINFGFVLIAIVTSLRSTWNTLYSYAEKTCLATVHVKGEDVLYDDIIRWMTDHAFRHRNFLSAMAQTTNESDNKSSKSKTPANSRPTRSELDTPVSYKESDDSSAIELKPFHGSRLFRFKGRWIYFSHTSNNPENTARGPQIEGKPQLTLQCLSLSLSPLKVFLDEARAYSRKVSISTVKIYRTKLGARDVLRWSAVASRPSRDIATVILDQEKKQTLLRDVNEYLHPHTRQWYANHGIPYRRGYLFSGPPGTGKTSLASAIAGVFGLDIYVLSLQDPTMTESNFNRLFAEVPTRCVVLLEDVDAAGLNRGDLVPNKDQTQTMQPSAVNASTISLSALLNAIDGVSSQEGRILIMTTNMPQELDRALIRPGRVDLHIRFQLPSPAELRELFLSLYSDAPYKGLHDASQEKKEMIQKERLDGLADTFSKSLPENRFSVAEVQGFLLRYKQHPEEACENIGNWIKEMYLEN
ncbi:BCS1 and AAA domain-containing protein [Aspergillus stella-maris]|uniref:BCS1 and AAA domain-containing protein n=1 Tax=Aspergillus stella-maris TaxID=1810926 RepID=UPI003CCCD11D